VDITAPGLRSVLNALVEASVADLCGGRDLSLFVKVEQGITRCVCGSAGTLYVLSPHRRLTCFFSYADIEDDPDVDEFMVQCETCKVWQHRLCMGYQSEDQVHG
jgi:hypothetical protein